MSAKSDEKRLAELAEKIEAVEAELKPLYAERNKIIRRSTLSIRGAASAAKITPPRVQQIRRK